MPCTHARSCVHARALVERNRSNFVRAVCEVTPPTVRARLPTDEVPAKPRFVVLRREALRSLGRVVHLQQVLDVARCHFHLRNGAADLDGALRAVRSCVEHVNFGARC